MPPRWSRSLSRRARSLGGRRASPVPSLRPSRPLAGGRSCMKRRIRASAGGEAPTAVEPTPNPERPVPQARPETRVPERRPCTARRAVVALAAARRSPGLWDVLSPAEACAALGVPLDGVGSTWLRDNGLLLALGGEHRVIWADVLDALRRGSPAQDYVDHGEPRGVGVAGKRSANSAAAPGSGEGPRLLALDSAFAFRAKGPVPPTRWPMPPASSPTLVRPSAPPVARGPITKWSEAARRIGVSVDTVARRRLAWGLGRKPCFFRDEEELLAWWRTGPSKPPTDDTRASGLGSPPRRSGTSARTGGTTLAALKARNVGSGTPR